MNGAAIDDCFALMLSDDAAARGPLEQAWQHAHAAGDLPTQWLLAATAILAIHADCADFRGLATWIERFQAGEQATPELERETDRQRVDCARIVLPALDHRFAFDSDHAHAAAQRLLDGLREGRWPAGDEFAQLAKALFIYHTLEYDSQAAERLAALASPGIAAASVGWQARWWIDVEANLDFIGQHEAAAEVRRRLDSLAGREGSEMVAWDLAVLSIRAALREGDAAAQDRAYAQIERQRTTIRPGLLPRGLFRQAQLLMARGRVAEALEKLDVTLDVSEDVQVPERDRCVYHELRVYALAVLQRWEEAIAEAQGLRRHQTGAQAQVADLIVDSVRAAAALQREHAEATALSLQLLRGAAALPWRRFLQQLPVAASRVLAIGWDAGVEREFVRRVALERKIAPPQAFRSDWPWPLRVYAFGPLRIERDGVPVADGGKAQRKPLDLLGLLAASGGRPLAAEVAIDQLWPSLDADAPKASLAMALSRLRKLLGLAEAVQFHEGRLSLHPALVWCDVGAFDSQADAAEQGDDDAVDALCAIYTAPLMPGNSQPPLVLARRDQLAQRFARVVEEAALRPLGRGDAARAVHWLRRACELDPLSEPLTRALMRAHLAHGDRAEALRSFDRCRLALQAAMNIQPSAATRALRESLLAS